MVAIDRRGLLQAGAGALLAGLALRGNLLHAADGESLEALLAHVHPELRDAARQLIEADAGRPAFTDETIAAMREGSIAQPQDLLPDIAVHERRIPARGSLPEVSVFIANSDPGRRRPAILHLHGGGYILGSARNELRYVQDTARALDCTIVSAEYRLAPETRYTGSVEDNYSALHWLHANANELGVDPALIAVMGESAGGGHAALLAIAARDRGEVPLVLQALVYPMLDDRTGSGLEVPWPLGRILWDAESNHYGWRAFLGAEPGSSAVPAAGVPARIADAAGLVPAWIGVGGLDLFLEEDLQYATRLTNAGVPVELLLEPRAFHGFERIMPDAGPSRRFTAAKHAALRRAFNSKQS